MRGPLSFCFFLRAIAGDLAGIWRDIIGPAKKRAITFEKFRSIFREKFQSLDGQNRQTLISSVQRTLVFVLVQNLCNGSLLPRGENPRQILSALPIWCSPNKRRQLSQPFYSSTWNEHCTSERQWRDSNRSTTNAETMRTKFCYSVV